MNCFPTEQRTCSSIMENFPERCEAQCFPKLKTLFPYMTEESFPIRLLLSPAMLTGNGLNKGRKAFNKRRQNKVR